MPTVRTVTLLISSSQQELRMTKKQRNQYVNYDLNMLHFQHCVINNESSVLGPAYDISFFWSITITLAFKINFERASACDISKNTVIYLFPSFFI